MITDASNSSLGTYDIWQSYEDTEETKSYGQQRSFRIIRISTYQTNGSERRQRRISPRSRDSSWLSSFLEDNWVSVLPKSSWQTDRTLHCPRDSLGTLKTIFLNQHRSDGGSEDCSICARRQRSFVEDADATSSQSDGTWNPSCCIVICRNWQYPCSRTISTRGTVTNTSCVVKFVRDFHCERSLHPFLFKI